MTFILPSVTASAAGLAAKLDEYADAADRNAITAGKGATYEKSIAKARTLREAAMLIRALTAPGGDV